MGKSVLEYKIMEAKQMNECALLASAAFADYEYFSIYIPEDRKRKKFLDALLKCEFRANIHLDSVRFLTAWENGKIVAVAQLCSPDFVKPNDMAYLKNGWIKVLLSGGSKPVNAWLEMEKQASVPCHSLQGNTWYISLLTVDRSQEGKGIGSSFIHEAIIPYVKENGAEKLCLFTNSLINREFYQKNGFTEFDARSFSYGGKSIGNWSYVMDI